MTFNRDTYVSAIRFKESTKNGKYTFREEGDTVLKALQLKNIWFQ